MKILIMVLSFNEPPYSELMMAQQETFDSINVDGVRTIYYHGGYDKENILKEGWVGWEDIGSSWERFAFKCTDAYYFMAGKFKMALDFTKGLDYDFIFRTNSSSYVNKKRLKQFAATLPTEKLYAGKTLVDLNDFSGLAVSGAGIWLSRDTADILRNEIDPAFEMEEDIVIGRILRKHGITAIEDNSRIDYTGGVQQQLVIAGAQPYHIRFKTSDRLQDAENMRLVHKMITK